MAIPRPSRVFDLQSVATDHLPADFPGGPLPPALDAESVPTTVTIGPDGAIYVGELKGFPFRPGTSNIWRIKPGAEGAWCSVNEPDPTHMCSLYSDGYTAIQDIAFDKRSGQLYVYDSRPAACCNSNRRSTPNRARRSRPQCCCR